MTERMKLTQNKTKHKRSSQRKEKNPITDKNERKKKKKRTVEEWTEENEID